MSISSSCQDTQNASISYEPEETVIVRGGSSDATSPTANPAENVPDTTRASREPANQLPAENKQDSAAERNETPGELILGKRFKVTVPAHWVKKNPAVSFIEYEFAVPSTVEGEPNGRITFMAAGGGVNANIERWIRQFRFPPGQNENQAVIRKQLEVAGQKVHLGDITGSYLEPGGPMMETVIARDGYRMLGAIIESDDGFLYFVKFYGPEKTVAENESAFRAMIESLRDVASE